MKSLITAAMLLSASPFTAHAETFTFILHGDTTGTIVVPDPSGGAPATAITQKGTFDIVSANGTKRDGTFTSASWSTGDRELPLRGIGQQTDPTGTLGVTYACAADKAATTGDCWARVVGETGAYKGRTGTSSWHFSIKGTKDTTTGVAQLND